MNLSSEEIKSDFQDLLTYIKEQGQDAHIQRVKSDIERLEVENRRLKEKMDKSEQKALGNSTLMEGSVLEEKFKKLENNFFLVKDKVDGKEDSRVEDLINEMKQVKTSCSSRIEGVADSVYRLEQSLLEEKRKALSAKKG